MTHPHPNRRFVPQAVLTKSGKINTAGASVNTVVRPVNTAGSKPTVNHPRPISNAYKKGYSQVTRPFNKYSEYKNSIFNKKVNTVRVKDTTARDRAVVSENKGKGVNAVKASACWGNSQQKEYKERGVIDSGCSRHMNGNKCYLTEYEDYDGGFVSFLLDESQVLLIVPRKDNICSVDLKSVVPTKGLTCLFTKATIDESNLWHRRLGHINFKNMNKLVRGNLVRGLPSKIFENDHSCVACQKGKQHKNGVAERRNRTLIEAARTMCLVTILNTRDNLGKFDRKADEGFFVGYCMVSKAMRVFNKRTRIVEETLNITFLENAPNVTGNGPYWLFDVDSLTISMNYVPVVAGNQTNGIAGTRDNIVADQAEKKKEPEQEYILIPFCTTDPLISQDPKVSEEDAKEKPTEMDESGASDKDGKDEQVTRSEFERPLQQEQQTKNPNCTNSINTVSTPVSTAGPSCTDDDPSSPVNAAEASNAFEEHLFERFSPFKNAFTLPPVSNVTPMDDTGIFGNAYDDEDVGAEADLNNLETTMNVSPIPTTRIDKDHPKDQIIGDFNSAIQTRRMTKISDEHAMIEAMQEELLQFKLQKVWTLVDLPNGYTQEEGINYDKVFAHVAKIEAIRLFFAYASFMGFIVYQMDVTSAFLYGTIEEEVKQKDDGIFISQDKYVADILKKFDFVTVKTATTPIETNKALLKDEEARIKRIFRYLKGQPKLGLWYPRDSPFDLEAFSYNDYAGASLDRKSTTGEYVAAANCCGQVLWIQNQMLNYGFNFMNTKIHIDNESTICIVKNPVFHAKTKHIEIRYHFIKDSYEKRLIQVIKIHTDHNVADLLTKAFDVSSISNEFRVKTGGYKVNAARRKKGKDFSGRVTSLFASMLEPPVVEGEGSGQPSEPQPASSTAQPRIKEQIPVTEPSSPQNTQSPRQALQEDTQKLVQVTDPGGNTPRSDKERIEQDDLTDFVLSTPYDSPLSGGHTPGSDEGRPNINELMAICINLSNRVLALEQSKTAQDLVIRKLKKKVRKLEKKLRARTPGMKLFKIGTSKRKSLDGEYVSKQGRKSDKTKPMFDDSNFAELDVDNAMENVKGYAETQGRNTIDVDSVAGPLNVSTVDPSISTVGDIFEDEMMTIVDTLMAIRSTRPRTTSVVIRDIEEEPRRATPVPTVQSQDKGKGKMAELERMQREKAAQEEASNAALIAEFDNVQARIEADALLAARLQEKEREQFSIDEQLIFSGRQCERISSLLHKG
ncbi:putative ribonuclease H-like domain-containing protein [Tanacetum coccineum]